MLFHKNELKEFNKKFNEPYGEISNTGKYNTILSKNYSLGMNSKKTSRNNNVMVLGGNGTGKERCFAIPNLLKANSSYVVIDDDEIYETYKDYFVKEGYRIKLFNLVDVENHNFSYNPFKYIKCDMDVEELTQCIINGDLKSAEGLLLESLIFYLVKYRKKEDQNFTSVLKLLNAITDEKSPVDCLFDEVEQHDARSIALKYYKAFKMKNSEDRKEAIKKLKALIGLIENITKTDNLELEKLGDEKTILFIKRPPVDDTYYFIMTSLINQAINTLREYSYKKKLTYHCRFIITDFIGLMEVPHLGSKMSSLYKYNMSCCICEKSITCLREIYKEETEKIIKACDTVLFFGSSDPETYKYIFERVKEGNNSSINKKKNTKIKDIEDISRMSNNKCIILIKELGPIIDDKNW